VIESELGNKICVSYWNSHEFGWRGLTKSLFMWCH